MPSPRCYRRSTVAFVARIGLGVLLLGSACRSGESVAATGATPVDPSTPAPDAQPPTDPSEEPGLPPLPDRAVVDEVVRAAKERAQREVLAAGEPSQPELLAVPEGGLPGPALAADPMPGFFAPLQLPATGDPLAPLEHALAELEAGQRAEPVRLAIYGASGTAADLWTGYLRRYLQARFGDGGPGIISAVPQSRWYRHHELSVKCSKKHWTKYNAYRPAGEGDPGLWGPMGVCHEANNKRAWSEIGKSRRTPADRQLAFYEVLHLSQPGGGSYRAIASGQSSVVSTATEGAPALGTHRVPVSSGHPKLRLEVVGDGPVRMLGVIAETGKPGVVVDTYGMDGARITNLLDWNESLWAQSIQRRKPVLYMLGFGTNSSVDEEAEAPIADWEAGFRTIVERFTKTLPDAGCIILGPGDYPIVERGKILPRPRLAAIRAIERRLAAEFGCAYWDALTFAGGEGAKAAWVGAGLARDDYLHLTRAGYVRLGIAISDALMQRYDWRRVQQAKQ